MNGLLFLCVYNSVRSQIAEGLARQMVPKGVRVYSAGSKPSVVNAAAIEVLAEVGIDASAQRSKGLGDVPMGEIDTVITLCAEEECPVLPSGIRRIHWPLPDPGTMAPRDRDRLAPFRATREEIRIRLEIFLKNESA